MINKSFLKINGLIVVFSIFAQEEFDKKYELFKQIMVVRSYAENVISSNLGKAIGEGEDRYIIWKADIAPREALPTPSKYSYRTDQGLILSTDGGLITPWGKVDLFNIYCTNGDSIFFTEKFFKNFNLALKYCEHEGDYQLLGEKFSTIKRGKVSQFSVKDIKNFHGTSTIIQSNMCGVNCYYNILDIGGKGLPKSEKILNEEADKKIIQEWEALYWRYKKENNLLEKPKPKNLPEPQEPWQGFLD